MRDGVFIWTVPGDIHARAVEWALGKIGVSSEVWVASDFPSRATIGIEFSQKNASLRFCHEKNFISLAGMRTLWRRREGLPVFDPALDPADLVPAQVESKQFLDGCNQIIDSNFEFSANPYIGALRSRNKVEQLSVARIVGLKIPDTLITNNASDLAEFCDFGQRNVIIKSFTSPSWITDEHCFYVYAKQINKDFLLDEKSISAVPSIYQERIEKQFEVRAFIFGEECISVKILSQNDELSKDDWRRVRTHEMSMEAHVLPQPILEKCIALMRQLGIVCGSFDFAVNKAGEYIFFEVNEQGQFLWMEQRLPELQALNKFSRFLIDGSSSFRYNGDTKNFISFSEFVTSGSWGRAYRDEQNCATYYHRPPYIEDGDFEDFANSMRAHT